MSIEQNKARYRQFFEEVWNQKKIESLDDFLADDYVDLTLPPDQSLGREGEKQASRSFFVAFPDLAVTLDEVVAEGEQVVAIWTARATHRGEYMGIPATNRAGKVTGVSMARIVNGKIVTSWGLWDRLSLLQQLGIVPLAFGQTGA